MGKVTSKIQRPSVQINLLPKTPKTASATTPASGTNSKYTLKGPTPLTTTPSLPPSSVLTHRPAPSQIPAYPSQREQLAAAGIDQKTVNSLTINKDLPANFREQIGNALTSWTATMGAFAGDDDLDKEIKPITDRLNTLFRFLENNTEVLNAFFETSGSMDTTSYLTRQASVALEFFKTLTENPYPQIAQKYTQLIEV